MARTVRNSKIDSPSARAKLQANKSGYWVSITAGCAVGYRKGAKSGTFVAKFVKGSFRQEVKLGTADDIVNADGVVAISYGDAHGKAHKWFAEIAREAAGGSPNRSRDYTVCHALTDYMADYRRRGGKSERDTQTTIDAFILPSLGQILVSNLTTNQIRDWHSERAKTPPRLRRKRSIAEQPYADHDPADPVAVRRRRATANRNLTVLKAALNHAFREGFVESDQAWRRVRPFAGVDVPKIQYLTVEQSRMLVQNADVEFRPMITAALLTGCRYSELTALKVRDFDQLSKTLNIGRSKSGKPRNIALTEEGVDFFSDLACQRSPDSLLLIRKNGAAWGKSYQIRPMAETCQKAGICPAVSFHVLRHTYATLLLQKGTTLPIIAAGLGHADSRMTERHYAHLSPNLVADTIRAALPRFVM